MNFAVGRKKLTSSIISLLVSFDEDDEMRSNGLGFVEILRIFFCVGVLIFGGGMVAVGVGGGSRSN
jgi:hypothetical protein